MKDKAAQCMATEKQSKERATQKNEKWTMYNAQGHTSRRDNQELSLLIFLVFLKSVKLIYYD